MADLPAELILLIAQHGGPRVMANMTCVCSSWRAVLLPEYRQWLTKSKRFIISHASTLAGVFAKEYTTSSYYLQFWLNADTLVLNDLLKTGGLLLTLKANLALMLSPIVAADNLDTLLMVQQCKPLATSYQRAMPSMLAKAASKGAQKVLRHLAPLVNKHARRDAFTKAARHNQVSSLTAMWKDYANDCTPVLCAALQTAVRWGALNACRMITAIVRHLCMHKKQDFRGCMKYLNNVLNSPSPPWPWHTPRATANALRIELEQLKTHIVYVTFLKNYYKRDFQRGIWVEKRPRTCCIM